MTDKERLEKIRKGIELVDKHEVSDRTKMVDFRHWSYELLKIAVEQAKRVQELEKQNKRYREALKNIYDLAEYDEYDNVLEQIVSEVEKALEGDDD